ncbi:flagellar protein FlaG [Pseudomonas sp. LP_7_YM]|uniref:flagellar protein FlaG n=1 Tax=Pseudomonas sp. LP_7_YM TaxID=2485137 RepID=UPI00105B5ED3|nr:flagellar protein FlaG [Pseudomonas sp. LP_7_YM]TDV67996.1 flagellar protein FlaG [Pseudomonas sp. LP_7_YM]
MDISTRLSVTYPVMPLLPVVPVAADKSVGAPQIVSAPAASADTDASKSKDSSADADKKSKELKAAVQDMDKFFNSVRRNLEFSIDEGSGEVVVKVIATETGEVVRQLPSAEALKIADSLKNADSMKHADSLLFDAKA